MPGAFETAVCERANRMLESCTRCGKCFEVCPITGPAGLGDAEPAATIAGILDLVRTGTGPEPARRWASSCVSSGECIKACNYGVNPRFLLNMARVAMARAQALPHDQKKSGVEGFRLVVRDVVQLSRMQLGEDELRRLGQDPSAPPSGDPPPDVVFYTGCNILKTPHIALLALDILEAIGVSYHVMGGPSHCCGIVQMRTGDIEGSGRFAENTLDKLARSRTGTVLAWCPTCLVQFNEVTLPAVERTRGRKPFEMTPFFLFLQAKLDALRPLLRQRVPMRIALHRHNGAAGVMEAAAQILSAVPGIELVDLGQPAPGLMSNYLRALPAYKRALQLKELEAVRDAGLDALAVVYHADYRELCAHERDWPFQILSVLEFVGQSMGLYREAHYKRLKLKQDIEAIMADCRELAAAHQLDPGAQRLAVQSMLQDQPLPLGSNPRPDGP